ncbi:hypothetical protein E2C01_068910 [Portunus trituberculatus]|uniref:Uncharacterized protein n=1 Tax=Portunus trituberculatus TaxID=210409 RepID=A0A5B7HXZ8_PORTR|nr:hypothetical protein [Portunus trituberculatus]
MLHYKPKSRSHGLLSMDTARRFSRERYEEIKFEVVSMVPALFSLRVPSNGVFAASLPSNGNGSDGGSGGGGGGNSGGPLACGRQKEQSGEARLGGSSYITDGPHLPSHGPQTSSLLCLLQ